MASNSVDVLREIQERMMRLRAKHTGGAGGGFGGGGTGVGGNSASSRESREVIELVLGELKKGISSLALEVRTAEPFEIKASLEELAAALKEILRAADYIR